MFSKKDKIPKGHYCYSYDKDGKFKCCPFWTQKKINDVNVTWCEFLNKGDVPNGTSEADFEKLKFVYGPKNEDVWKALPLDLLWDQVKECGENEDY